MIRTLYEKLTGRPWTTTRSMSAEYGPPPGAVYAVQLAHFSDAELLAHGERILAHLQAQDATGRSATPRHRPTSRAGARVSHATPAHHLMSDHTIVPLSVDR